MLGSGLNSSTTMSPPPAATKPSSFSATYARTSGSTSRTARGVKPRETSLRNAVCSGGSSITIGGLSARPIFSSSPYSTVRPCALENVAVSTAARSTSSWRDRT